MDECTVCGSEMEGLICQNCGASHQIDYDGRLVNVSADDDLSNGELISIF